MSNHPKPDSADPLDGLLPDLPPAEEVEEEEVHHAPSHSSPEEEEEKEPDSITGTYNEGDDDVDNGGRRNKKPTTRAPVVTAPGKTKKVVKKIIRSKKLKNPLPKRKKLKNPITIQQMRGGVVDPEVHSRYVNEIIHFLQWVSKAHPSWLTEYCKKQQKKILTITQQNQGEGIHQKRKRIKAAYMKLIGESYTTTTTGHQDSNNKQIIILKNFTPEGIMEFLASQANQKTGERLSLGGYSGKRSAIKHLVRCQEGKYWDEEFEGRLEYLWRGFIRVRRDDNDTESDSSDNNGGGGNNNNKIRKKKKKRKRDREEEQEKQQQLPKWELPDWILKQEGMTNEINNEQQQQGHQLLPEEEEETTDALPNTHEITTTTLTEERSPLPSSSADLVEQVYKRVMEKITSESEQGRDIVDIIAVGAPAVDADAAGTTTTTPPIATDHPPQLEEGQLTEGRMQEIIATSLRGPFKALGDQIKELASTLPGVPAAGVDGQQQHLCQQQRYPYYDHGNGLQSRLPKDYEFPNSGLYDLWLKWNIADGQRKAPPLRLLIPSDYAFLNKKLPPKSDSGMVVKEGCATTGGGKHKEANRRKASKLLTDIRFVCNYIEEKATAAGMDTNDRSPTNVRLMYETVSCSLFDDGRTNLFNGKQLKWKTAADRLRKKAKEEKEARDAAASGASTSAGASVVAVARNDGEKEDDSPPRHPQTVVPPQMQQQQQQLHPRPSVWGGQQLTGGKLQQIIGASLEGPLKCLGDQIKELVSTFEASSAPTTILTGQTDAEGYPYRLHDNNPMKASRLPEDYEFPRAGVYDLWLKWNIGNKEREIPPLRNLLPQDYAFLDKKPKSDEMKKGATGKYKDNRRRASVTYCDIKFVCKYIEDKAKAVGIDTTDRSPTNVRRMFEAASSSLFEGENPEDGLELKWQTIVGKLRKKVQEENKAATAASPAGATVIATVTTEGVAE